jgi:glycosyltransferase involved in cell wall biosynthesis
LPPGVSLRYWRNRPPLGQAGNVNRLFENARGSRLVLLHDDDVLMSGAVTALASAWNDVPGILAVFGLQNMLHHNGEVDPVDTAYKARYFKRDQAHAGLVKDIVASAFARQFPNNGYLVDTAAARSVGYRPFEAVGHACDTDFSVRLALAYRERSFFMINRTTSGYRNNLESLSRSTDITWRLFDELCKIRDLDPHDAAARDRLLCEIAAQAVKENALGGRRAAVLRILFSRYYPLVPSIRKPLYHLALTAVPGLEYFRRSSALARLVRAEKAEMCDAAPAKALVGLPRDAKRPFTLTLVSQVVKYGHGQGRANLELVREALARGYIVNLVASDVDDTLLREPNVRVHMLDVERLPTQLVRDVVFDLRARAVIRKLRTTSDILHVNGAVVMASSDVNSVHFVHRSHAQYEPTLQQAIRSPYRLYQRCYTIINTFMERRSFRQARFVVAVSDRVRNDLFKLGVSAQRIKVIYNGVDLAEFVPGDENRATLGLPKDVVLAIFVGDIKNTRKNLDTVLQALVRCDGVHLAVLADIAGSDAAARAAQLGIADRVHFLGERQDVAAIMRSADMMVFPSRYEPFGMVVLEAMASGLAVITSRAAGVSEIIEPGSGILLDDPNDVGELTAAIKSLVKDPALRQRLAKSGRSIAERYSWQSMAERYLECYESLAGSGAEPVAVGSQ